jgi:hypothetical protein
MCPIYKMPFKSDNGPFLQRRSKSGVEPETSLPNSAYSGRITDNSDVDLFWGFTRACHNTAEASEAYDRAIGLGEDPAKREFLLKKRV